MSTAHAAVDRRADARASFRGALGWLLIAGLGFPAAALAGQWLSARTERLYLDFKTPAPSDARQEFEIVDRRVEPRILAAASARLRFPVEISRPAVLRLGFAPASHATVEIAIVQSVSRRVLYREAASAAASVALPLPPGSGFLELVNEGEVAWSDPRVVHGTRGGPVLLGLLALSVLASLAVARSPLGFRAAPRARPALFRVLATLVTVGLCLGALELGLRILGDRLPSWITDVRRDLGEVPPDPRWQASPLYGERLAPRIDTYCQWDQGDIVRMGFLAPGVASHPAYRFPFVTDAEGFRNPEPEDAPAVVAALGDSFTDGMTLPAELTWPARLSKLLGVRVRNYGTAGFGPGQELLVLKQHVQARHPRRVVVGFFAGNDLVDAERFDTYRRNGRPLPVLRQGWRFKSAISRLDTLYLTSLYEGVARALQSRSRPPLVLWPSRPPDEFNGGDPGAGVSVRASFDRGLFTLPVAGRALQFAFLPPYLDRLKLSRRDLEASRGWDLTRDAYREMRDLVRGQGGELVVLFIPSKEQVYLPLLMASLSNAALSRAVEVGPGSPLRPSELELLMRNRLASNDLMRDFCAGEGMAFLDLTGPLEAALLEGRNVYFPDDSHWNVNGHETAARSLARLLSPDLQAPPPS